MIIKVPLVLYCGLPRSTESCVKFGLLRQGSASYPDVISLSMCAQRKAGPLWLITSHSRFALASAMRKTKRLRSRLDHGVLSGDQALFSLRFVNNILARPHKRECMRNAKIGPDLRLRVCQKNLTLPELPIFKPWVTNNVTIIGKHTC